MGSVADAYDNAMCESFFATLECELLDRRPLRTQAEARMAVFEFIEAWYNPHRRHSPLGYRSPCEFELGSASATPHFVGARARGKTRGEKRAALLGTVSPRWPFQT